MSHNDYSIDLTNVDLGDEDLNFELVPAEKVSAPRRAVTTSTTATYPKTPLERAENFSAQVQNARQVFTTREEEKRANMVAMQGSFSVSIFFKS
jgi:hydroxylamine reductase (hybrid-cluster protein)